MTKKEKQEEAFSIFLRDAGAAFENGILWELPAIIEVYIKNKLPDTEKIRTVLESVANSYSISKDVLLNSNKRGNVQTARDMAYCLFCFELGYSRKFIANVIFKTQKTTVQRGITFFKELKMTDPFQKKFSETYNLLKNKINVSD